MCTHNVETYEIRLTISPGGLTSLPRRLWKLIKIVVLCFVLWYLLGKPFHFHDIISTFIVITWTLLFRILGLTVQVMWFYQDHSIRHQTTRPSITRLFISQCKAPTRNRNLYLQVVRQNTLITRLQAFNRMNKEIASCLLFSSLYLTPHLPDSFHPLLSYLDCFFAMCLMAC